MLVTILFPIADGRAFLPALNLRLPLPDWPEPNTAVDPQFVHHFGKAYDRVAEPDEAWPDELKFCRAKRAIRFDRLEMRHIDFSDRRFLPRCAFRRLFCDGNAVVRVEIGIAHKHWIQPLDNVELEEVLEIARRLAELPTTVPALQDDVKLKPLLSQGKNLSKLFASASMNREATERLMGFNLVEAGAPMILVEVSSEEADKVEPQSHGREGLISIGPECVNGAKALFCRLETTPGIVSTWIVQKGHASIGQLRSLRLCLTRLHTERVVLDLVLKQIHRNLLIDQGDQEAANLLDEYFNTRIKLVNRSKWGGMKQSQIISAFDATQSVVRPASQAQLISRYDGSRRQVWRKIETFQKQLRATRLVHVLNIEKGAIVVDKQVNVSGTGNIVNVAEYMSNVTNTVNNNLAESNADSEVKSLTKELNEQIELVAQKADPSQTKKLGKNLEALSRELASEEPERRWYEVSLEGIKEAAQAIGEIATPILTTVGKLTALLLP